MNLKAHCSLSQFINENLEFFLIQSSWKLQQMQIALHKHKLKNFHLASYSNKSLEPPLSMLKFSGCYVLEMKTSLFPQLFSSRSPVAPPHFQCSLGTSGQWTAQIQNTSALQKVLIGEKVIWKCPKLSGEDWPRWGIGQPWNINEGTRHLWKKEMVVQHGYRDSRSVTLVALTTNSLSDLGQRILFPWLWVYSSGK